MAKSKEELELEQKEAKEKLEAILSSTAPKNLREGVSSGVSNIVKGAVGGAGVLVLLPIMGGAVGAKQAGIVGGAFGLAIGAVGGVIGGAALIVSGAVSGVVQIGRGVAAVPQQIIAPRKGKYWNEYDGKWVYSDLSQIAEEIKDVPEDNRDLLGDIEKDLDDGKKKQEGLVTEVADMFYYETLDVAPDADKGTIKRNYYKLARKYHPDKNPGDEEAADKFKVIGEAYQVLSDDDKRIIYNKEGRDGLQGQNDDEAPKLDPVILFTFLFGSDKFNDITGQLASATSSRVGDSPEVSLKVARQIQQRRVGRLALKLVDRIEGYVNVKKSGGSTDEFVAKWLAEGQDLSTASFGYQMVTTCGKVYNLVAVQHLGSLESGLGMPAMAKWAEAQHARIEAKKSKNKNEMDKLKAGMDMMKMAMKYQEQINAAETDEEKEKLQMEMQKAAIEVTLRLLWATNVVDITATLHETCQIVFYDKTADEETKQARAEAVQALGETWMNMEPPEGASGEEKDAAKMYEEAAFAAMLETIKRKDEASHGKS
mmetsp:Transcript_35168/g.73237  ORF Transcript_35168/g.73237 Transcript_35168/m.73237 type:complete len:540 (-) Transcript_35168:1168-2787(-)|eukprot:CAMPEP_0172474976 /NCGR_PEP_ID=MMETSP1065-20121228/69633_1 /TAXON_ID=265537 /ORGANISM="Amphiprora paludosa, Strain CCMP125" /LENGTH=539 /DNA_ID=CAMNT_0013233169 /DNA_START=35 /DNA_END=1654 /DNA_ORIENTATION=+